jgi:hypothetical protein
MSPVLLKESFAHLTMKLQAQFTVREYFSLSNWRPDELRADGFEAIGEDPSTLLNL